MGEEEMLSCAQVAKRFGVNVQTVRGWVRKGIIGHVKVGPHGITRIPLSEAVKHFAVKQGVD